MFKYLDSEIIPIQTTPKMSVSMKMKTACAKMAWNLAKISNHTTISTCTSSYLKSSSSLVTSMAMLREVRQSPRKEGRLSIAELRKVENYDIASKNLW